MAHLLKLFHLPMLIPILQPTECSKCGWCRKLSLFWHMPIILRLAHTIHQIDDSHTKINRTESIPFRGWKSSRVLILLNGWIIYTRFLSVYTFKSFALSLFLCPCLCLSHPHFGDASHRLDEKTRRPYHVKISILMFRIACTFLSHFGVYNANSLS